MPHYCQCQTNPLIRPPKLKTPPAFIRELAKSPTTLAREVQGYKTTALYHFVNKTYSWLHKYGIPSIGYTFMPASTYYVDAQKQFRSTKFLKQMMLPCDGFLLVSTKSYSPMHGILSEDLDTNIAESFRKEVGGSEEKVIKILRELRRELEERAERNDIRIGDALPRPFKPTDKHHYKAGTYDVYPLWFGESE